MSGVEERRRGRRDGPLGRKGRGSTGTPVGQVWVVRVVGGQSEGLVVGCGFRTEGTSSGRARLRWACRRGVRQGRVGSGRVDDEGRR